MPSLPHLEDCAEPVSSRLVTDQDGEVRPSASSSSRRTTDGLVVLYDFSEGSGRVVYNRSGSGAPLDLIIQDTNN